VITGAILLAAAAWAFTFAVPWGNFWAKIGLAVLLVSVYSFAWQKPSIRFHLKNILMGAFSAALLYVIFLAGYTLSPYLITSAHSEVRAIYDLGSKTSRLWVFLLLALVTGPGEEIFWRSFLQERFMARIGNVPGYMVTTLIYAGVHVFSKSLMLVGAAFVAGAFWGALYLWKRDLGMVIVSHSLWSAFIFAVLPIA